MRVTSKLKEWAVKSTGLAADASDEAVTKAASEAIASGKLTVEQFGELTKATEAENRVREIVAEEITKSVTPKFDAIMTAIKGNGSDQAGNAAATTASTGTTSATDGQPNGQKSANVTGTVAKEGQMTDTQKAFSVGGVASGADAGGNGGSADDFQVRVKSVVEQFDGTTSALTYQKSSKDHLVKAFGHQQVKTGTGDSSRSLNAPSERTKAIAGAWLKHLINRAFKSKGAAVPRAYRMTELDRKLCEYAVHECKFVGPLDFDDSLNDADHWFGGQKVTNDLHRKALLDDSLSGGIEAVPYEFDDAAIITPLLNGEIYPYVQQVNVGRRRMYGFSIANPIMTWGTAEGSSVPLLDTDSLIGAFDTTVFPISGSMELGMDFEADTPVNMGEILMDRYGQAFLTAMDNVLVTGSGINCPLGLLNTAGVTTITPTNPTVTSPSPAAAGPQTVADYEGLFFGVKKAYRQKPNRNFAFIGSEVSYSRARGIQVSTSDQRRVFGTDNYESYSLLGQRYAINESTDLGNTKILGAALSYYRLYRRQGYEVRVVTEDAELARKNQRLILVRARFGGQMTLAGAMTKIVDAAA